MASLTRWTLLAAHVPLRSQTGHVARATLLNSGITKKTSGGSQHDGVKNGPICCWAEINGTSRGPGLCHRNSTAPAAAASQRLPIHSYTPLSTSLPPCTFFSPASAALSCWIHAEWDGVYWQLFPLSATWCLFAPFFLILISSLEGVQKIFFLVITGKNLFPSKCSVLCLLCSLFSLVLAWNIWLRPGLFSKVGLVTHVYSSKVC